jgi:hypothetical protein
MYKGKSYATIDEVNKAIWAYQNTGAKLEAPSNTERVQAFMPPTLPDPLTQTMPSSAPSSTSQTSPQAVSYQHNGKSYATMAEIVEAIAAESGISAEAIAAESGISTESLSPDNNGAIAEEPANTVQDQSNSEVIAAEMGISSESVSPENNGVANTEQVQLFMSPTLPDPSTETMPLSVPSSGTQTSPQALHEYDGQSSATMIENAEAIAAEMDMSTESLSPENKGDRVEEHANTEQAGTLELHKHLQLLDKLDAAFAEFNEAIAVATDSPGTPLLDSTETKGPNGFEVYAE